MTMFLYSLFIHQNVTQAVIPFRRGGDGDGIIFIPPFFFGLSVFTGIGHIYRESEEMMLVFLLLGWQVIRSYLFS